MSITFDNAEKTRIYLSNNRAIIAGRDIASYSLLGTPIPTNDAPTQGYDLWALQVLAEEMAQRHSEIAKVELCPTAPDCTNRPADPDSQT